MEALDGRPTGERLLLEVALGDSRTGFRSMPQLPLRHLHDKALLRSQPENVFRIRFPQCPRRIQRYVCHFD